MEEKVKSLALLGTGALLGSAAAVAILKLLPRSMRKECIRETAKLNGIQPDNHPRIDNQSVGSIDLLNDDVVSEQLTR